MGKVGWLNIVICKVSAVQSEKAELKWELETERRMLGGICPNHNQAFFTSRQIINILPTWRLKELPARLPDFDM